MRKQVIIPVNPKGDFANYSFLKYYDGFDIELNGNNNEGYSFTFEPHTTYPNHIFNISPVVFDTTLSMESSNYDYWVNLYRVEIKFHSYSDDKLLNDTIHKIIDDNDDLITKAVEQLVEEVHDNVD